MRNTPSFLSAVAILVAASTGCWTPLTHEAETIETSLAELSIDTWTVEVDDLDGELVVRRGSNLAPADSSAPCPVIHAQATLDGAPMKLRAGGALTKSTLTGSSGPDCWAPSFSFPLADISEPAVKIHIADESAAVDMEVPLGGPDFQLEGSSALSAGQTVAIRVSTPASRYEVRFVPGVENDPLMNPVDETPAFVVPDASIARTATGISFVVPSGVSGEGRLWLFGYDWPPCAVRIGGSERACDVMVVDAHGYGHGLPGDDGYAIGTLVTISP